MGLSRTGRPVQGVHQLHAGGFKVPFVVGSDGVAVKQCRGCNQREGSLEGQGMPRRRGNWSGATGEQFQQSDGPPAFSGFRGQDDAVLAVAHGADLDQAAPR